MKKTALNLLFVVAAAGSAVAGPLRALPARPYEVTPSPLFRDQELFFDLYGSYVRHDERSSGHSGHSDRDGFGGGLSIGHYFGYYIGARFDVNFSSVDAAEITLGGDILLRYPIRETHVAPYVFAGGGVMLDHGDPGFFRLGGGLEWRFTPHFGIFGEGSYGWVYQDTDGENLLIKVGIRYIY